MDGTGEGGAARPRGRSARRENGARRQERRTPRTPGPSPLALLLFLTLPFTLPALATAQPAPAPIASADPALTTVQGLVVDSGGEPLEAVLVTTQEMGKDEMAGLATISERATGTFQLELPPGRWRLYFHRIGYRPATVHLVIRSAEPVPRLHIRLRDQRGPVAPMSLAAASPAATAIAPAPAR